MEIPERMKVQYDFNSYIKLFTSSHPRFFSGQGGEINILGATHPRHKTNAIIKMKVPLCVWRSGQGVCGKKLGVRVSDLGYWHYYKSTLKISAQPVEGKYNTLMAGEVPAFTAESLLEIGNHP